MSNHLQQAGGAQLLVCDNLPGFVSKPALEQAIRALRTMLAEEVVASYSIAMEVPGSGGG
jgi:hypothetical protein